MIDDIFMQAWERLMGEQRLAEMQRATLDKLQEQQWQVVVDAEIDAILTAGMGVHMNYEYKEYYGDRTFVLHCARCGQSTRVCGCGINWQEPHEGRATLDKMHLTGDGSGTPLPPLDGTVGRVFLPTEVGHEQTPAEETQGPSGWRDRPGML